MKKQVIESFSDGDSHTVFFKTGSIDSCANGVVVSPGNKLTHYLLSKELNDDLAIDFEVNRNAKPVTTSEGVFYAVAYDKPIKIEDYCAFYDEVIRLVEYHNTHTLADKKDVKPISLNHGASLCAMDKRWKNIIGQDTALDIMDSKNLVRELKKFYAETKRNLRDEDIQQIRPDIGSKKSGDGIV